MTFAIITHAPHLADNGNYAAYAPYVREMNIWLKYADRALIVAPFETGIKSPIHSFYEHSDIEFVRIQNFNILSVQNAVKALFKIPSICFSIYGAMQKADHVHLRCPGNIGLLGAVIQIFFPKKKKTAKYAGNWDPKSKQPFTYRLQKWILGNTFLTKNMKVLVYGEWPEMTENIFPFFTATYHESEIIPLLPVNLQGKIELVFAGTLVRGKNPLYVAELANALYNKGFDVRLRLFGDGSEREKIEHFITFNNLQNVIILEGNQNGETVKSAFQNSHFVLLPSESEGWPKVIAEGMFWGCIPVATKVSCVPFMLDYGKRGILLEMDKNKDVSILEHIFSNQEAFGSMRENASEWSRKYTLDAFESQIKILLEL